MNIIAHKFKKQCGFIINNLSKKELKSILGRERLKFSNKEIIYYLRLIYEHNVDNKTFSSLFLKYKPHIKYSCFMSNIALFSKLFKHLFNSINESLKIIPSKLFNIVDTTLIEEKRSKYITKKDWDLSRVTTRTKDTVKDYTCGSKGLIFINRFRQIYSAKLMNINYSDQNILKDYTNYLSSLKGFLLADRGFSNKAVRERLKLISDKDSIENMFKKPEQIINCKLISPYHYKEDKKLTTKEWKLYKRRWKIETIFQKIKHNYSETKLNLTGKYSKTLKTAKFYATLIAFNLSTTD